MDLRKLKDRATQEMAKHRFDKAAATYGELIEADPRDLQLRQKRGDALRAAGHADEAMQVYIGLADLYAKDGQLLKAIAVNKIVLELDPQHTQTQQRLAALYSRRTVVKSGAFVPIPLVNAVNAEPAPEAEPAASDLDIAMDDFLGAAATPDSEMADFLSAPEQPEAPAEEAEVEAPAEEAEVEAHESLADAAFDASLDKAFEDDALDAAAVAAAATAPAEQPESPAAEEPSSPILDLALEIEGDEPLFGDEIVFDDDFDLQAIDSAMAETLAKLPESPLFEGLDQQAFMDLVKRCERRAFKAGEVLVQQGDQARSFFVLNQGELMVVRSPASPASPGSAQEPVELARLHSGDFFGELALVSGSPRSASVIAVTEGDALEFSGTVLRELVDDHPEAAAALNRFTRARLLQNTMATSPLFRPFDRAQRKLLIARFVIRDVEPGTAVVTQGQPTDGLYVVMLGRFRVERDGQPLAVLEAGDIFGEISLLSRSKATASVISEGDGRLLRLPRKIFDELILTHPQVLELVSTLADERESRNAGLTGGKLAPDRDGLILV
jgi:CRP-like cAMP-binding protein